MNKVFIFILLLLGLSALTVQGQCVKDTLVLSEKENGRAYHGQTSVRMLEHENRLDSIWRKEDIWNKGLSFLPDKHVVDTTGIEGPQWDGWNNLEDYFIAHMKYPLHLLEKNQAGYSTVMFSLDTLGRPRGINILSTLHKEFDDEVIRLVKELPPCSPCKDRNGKPMECLYTVYVPFLPQHYRDRLKVESLAEERAKHSLVFCYDCDTLKQMLVVRRIDETKIDFELSSYNKIKKESKKVKGIAENKYSDCYGSEMDFDEKDEMYLVVEYLYESKELFLSFRFDKGYTKVNSKAADEAVLNQHCPLSSIIHCIDVKNSILKEKGQLNRALSSLQNTFLQ